MLTLFRIATDEAALKADGGKLPMPVSPASKCRLATGRSALLHLIKRLPRHHARTALLPCYVAEGVIQPFRKSEFTILFYQLREDLTPSAEDIAALLEQVNDVPVVVLVHYFGFPARSAALDSVLKRRNPIVVDDFAHSPFAKTASGRPAFEDAQLALFSLNKFLPVADGAILCSNRPDIDVSLDESALIELPDHVQQAYRDHLQSARDLFETKDSTQAKIVLRNLGSAYERYYSSINSDLRPFRQSAHSRKVEDAFPFANLAERRSSNGRILYEELDSPILSLVHPTLPSTVVPFCIPARVSAHSRAQLIDRLFEQGILLSTLQEKWNFVPADQRARYSVEVAFLDEHVLIPVSEFITAGSMREMVARLNDVHLDSA
jgi:hypothetical protein